MQPSCRTLSNGSNPGGGGRRPTFQATTALDVAALGWSGRLERSAAVTRGRAGSDRGAPRPQRRQIVPTAWPRHSPTHPRHPPTHGTPGIHARASGAAARSPCSAAHGERTHTHARTHARTPGIYARARGAAARSPCPCGGGEAAGAGGHHGLGELRLRDAVHVHVRGEVTDHLRGRGEPRKSALPLSPSPSLPLPPSPSLPLPLSPSSRTSFSAHGCNEDRLRGATRDSGPPQKWCVRVRLRSRACVSSPAVRICGCVLLYISI